MNNPIIMLLFSSYVSSLQHDLGFNLDKNNSRGLSHVKIGADENYAKFLNSIEYEEKKRIIIKRSLEKTGNPLTSIYGNKNLINSVFEKSRPFLNSKNRRRREISILGLFELSTKHGVRKEGYSELSAAQLAIRHINRRGLLFGNTLKLLTNDTKVSG